MKFLLRDKIIERIELTFLKTSVSLSLRIALSKNEIFVLEFREVEQYSLFSDEANMDQEGYLISHYKLFKASDLYYFSFDPFTENEIIEAEDNNYVYSKHVVGEIIKT